MKKLTKYFFIILSFILILTSISFSQDNIKLIPSGDVIFLSTECKYPYVSKILNEHNNKLKLEDVIISINNESLNDKSKLDIIKRNSNKLQEELELVIIRNNKEKNITIKKDELKQYKLDYIIQGIGTITAFNKNGEFYGLSHNIYLNKTNIAINSCDAYETSYLTQKKSKINNIGHLIANKKEIKIGESINIGEYGIKGKLVEDKYLNNKELEISEPQIGEAFLLCNTPITNNKKLHKINIIEVDEKMSKIEVIDEKLIKFRGGLVRGMSGSPIIQNNKIVGGLRSIYISNPKKGQIANINSILEN